MKNNQFGPFLSDKAVLAIVQQSTIGPVALAALDCNWTDRGKTSEAADYFNIWAAVRFHEKEDRVFLHGARFSNWTVEHEMKFACSAGNIGLYSLSLDNQDHFPNEFVIRLEREAGEQIYDNNDYRNYYVEHSKGYFATAISQDGCIFSFDSIVPIKVISYSDV
jgi:hypothetical protein